MTTVGADCIARGLTLDRHGATPLHRQLFEGIRDAILDGRIGSGERLPSTRSVAHALGIGRNTAIAAFDQLVAEGYVVTRTGAGTRVSNLPLGPHGAPDDRRGSPPPLSRRGSLLAVPRDAGPDLGAVAFQPGLPDVRAFPFEAWSRLLAREQRAATAGQIGYDAGGGHEGLRNAIARRLALVRGVRCTAEQVVIVAGAQAALDLVARTTIDPGDRCWIEEPGYLGARFALLAAGARLHPVPVDPDGIDVERGKRECPRARLAYVSPSSQFPLGVTLSLERRLALLDWAERADAWVVEDDYDSEYRYGGRPLTALHGLDGGARVVYVGSFSKVLFPGLRLGYVVAPPALATALRNATRHTGQAAPMFLQAALARFIEQGHLAAHVQRMRTVYAARQHHFVHVARSIIGRHAEVPSTRGGMQVACALRAGGDDEAVAARAAAQGLTVPALSRYYLGDSPRPGLYLGFAALDEAAARRALAALGRVLDAR